MRSARTGQAAQHTPPPPARPQASDDDGVARLYMSDHMMVYWFSFWWSMCAMSGAQVPIPQTAAETRHLSILEGG